MMKTMAGLLVTVTASAVFVCAQVDKAAFFRIVSTTNSSITEFSSDGTLVWTNAATDATCTVQRATTLRDSGDWVDYVQHAVTNATMATRLFDLNPPEGMAYIPAGYFNMGDSKGDGVSDELPVHSVYVSGFYMSKTEITKAQWDEVYNWAVSNGYSFTNAGSGKAASHPVQKVSWYDCVKWCNARSEKEGQTPCYTVGGQTYRTGENDDLECSWSAGGYRLPTEAEWEKAARGGPSGRRFPWGEIINHSNANYLANGAAYTYDTSPYTTATYHPSYDGGALPYTSPAGSFSANGFGLYDMTGNVWEFCWDWFDSTYYAASPASNPRGAVSGSGRVFRGGGWIYDAGICRAANRSSIFPYLFTTSVGFRVVHD